LKKYILIFFRSKNTF